MAVLDEYHVTDPVESILDSPASLNLSCTVWVGLCFRVGYFVGMVGVGWLLWGAKAAVGSVKSRVLLRLVYLVPMVAGCDCSWLFWLTSTTQAASCSAGVRIPIAE